MPKGVSIVMTVGGHETFFNANPVISLCDRVYYQFEKIGIECTQLTQGSSMASWGGDMSWTFPKQGDYAHLAWLSYTLPAISTTELDKWVRWCAKVGSNAVKQAWFDCNSITLEKIKSEYVDILTQCKYEYTKLRAYNSLIQHTIQYFTQDVNGNFVTTTNDAPQIPKQSHPAYRIIYPLYFWWTEYIEHSYPMLATLFSENKILCTFRNFTELIITNGTVAVPQLGEVKCYIDIVYTTEAARDRVLAPGKKNSEAIVFTTPYRQLQFHEEEIKEAQKLIKLPFIKPVKMIAVTTRETLAIGASYRLWSHLDRFEGNPNLIPMNQITDLTITSDGEDSYQGVNVKYLSKLIPLKFLPAVPDSENIFFIVWCTDPLNWRPTGFFNLSQINNLMLNITTFNIDSAHPATVFAYGFTEQLFVTKRGFGGYKYSS
jgi:hypothetical protein